MPPVSRATVSSIDSTRVRIVSTSACQPGQPLTAVGLGAGGGKVGTLGLGSDGLPLTEFGAGGLQSPTRFGQLVE